VPGVSEVVVGRQLEYAVHHAPLQSVPTQIGQLQEQPKVQEDPHLVTPQGEGGVLFFRMRIFSPFSATGL